MKQYNIFLALFITLFGGLAVASMDILDKEAVYVMGYMVGFFFCVFIHLFNTETK